MRVFKEALELRTHLLAERQKGRKIGFVPTMGALHQGHLSLVSRSLCDNDVTVVSIFVNPTQFNNPDDLKRYPRLPERDLKMLEEVGCTIAFLPDVAEIYPDTISTINIDLKGLDRTMEGEFRPGHFPGVATVVKRFFEIIEPHRAYFGEKDFQQLRIIQHMTKTLQPEVEIIGHPIERSKEGLALSSRNQLLNQEELYTATALYRTLHWARQNYSNFTPEELKEAIEVQLRQEPILVEYVEISDTENLQPLEDWITAPHARIFLAAFVGKVRLIDNVSLF